jgi:sec-independent protein translocase protein TatA
MSFASPWKDGLLVLVLVLLFFGPKRLPALSRSIGESVRELKAGLGGKDDEKPASELPADSRPESSGAAGPAEQSAATRS